MTVGVLSFIIREDCFGREIWENQMDLTRVLARRSGLEGYSFPSLTQQESFIIYYSAFPEYYTMTVMPKCCLHTVPDHDCWQICLASVEFEDYFGGKYVSTDTFQSVFYFFFFPFLFFFLPFSSSALLCRARKIFFGPFILHYLWHSVPWETLHHSR